MIKKIEDLKNIQIVCRNQEQVKNCLNYLKQLEFDVEDFAHYYNGFNLIFWGDMSEKFLFNDRFKYDLSIEFYNKELVKTLQKFIKEKEEQKREKKEEIKDFEVTSDGKIIKVNNWASEKQIFLLFVSLSSAINRFSQDCLIKYVNLGLVYSTEEARDKAIFKLEIETKLKNIAERLNDGRKIDWDDQDQEKLHIFYNYDKKRLDYNINFYWRNQGAIYCLGNNFLDVAKQEIGEENLIKYFKE